MNDKGLRSTANPSGLAKHFFQTTLLLAWTLLLFHPGESLRSAESSPASPSQPPHASNQAVLLMIQGEVETAEGSSGPWKTAQKNQTLKIGDRLRTGPKSRAELRWSDLCVIPVNESTTLTVAPPLSAGGGAAIQLNRGSLLFRGRERPQHIPFRTRSTSGAIRGTEFLLTVDEQDNTDVTLIDGEIEVSNPHGALVLQTGERAFIPLNGAPRKSPQLEGVNQLVQWTLYYPAILNPDEIPFNSTEKSHLSSTLEFYQKGDLLAALYSFPERAINTSANTQLFYAGLLLAVGQAAECEARLSSIPSSPHHAELAEALRGVIAAVRHQEWTTPPQPTLTSSWLAWSYYHQSQGKLDQALETARQASTSAPQFAFARVRLAELLFNHGHLAKARAELETALQISPGNAQAHALLGFFQLATQDIVSASTSFQKALEIDGALANAWLGSGLMKIRLRKILEGRQDLEVAASLEPHRAVLRSYLAKGFQHEGRSDLALKELLLASRLDPGDPTPWLYQALLLQQQNRNNEAIRALQRSQELNDNRQIYRSTHLLDQDRAVRSANLATLYQDAGMDEVALREASRAVTHDYLNYSSHLYLANAYHQLRDPRLIQLRYETPWFSEFLLANLLAPAGVATLSQEISQNEYGRLLERERFGIASTTEYWSQGDWHQSASQFGWFGKLSYAVDANYRHENGQRTNEDLEALTLSSKIKVQLTPQDSVFFQAIYSDSEYGDLNPYYDPRSANRHLRVEETQEPILLAGLHHAWQPHVHSLLLLGRYHDDFQVENPEQQVLVLAKDASGAISLAPRPQFTLPSAPLDYQSELELYSVEWLQLIQTLRHTLAAGLRYQYGEFDTQSHLGVSTPTRLGNDQSTTPLRFGTPADSQDVSPNLERFTVYAYDHWEILEPLILTAGISYDHLTYPENHRVAPITASEESRDQVSPKIGLTWSPLKNTHLRAAYTRSLGGVSFDQSARLEPIQVAGFQQAYRSLIPEAIVGSTVAPEFETWGLALDTQLAKNTFLTLEAQWLLSDSTRRVGARIGDVNVFMPNFTPDPRGLKQVLEYEEKQLGLTLNHLVGDSLALSSSYRLTESQLSTRTPQIPTTTWSEARRDETSILHQLQFRSRYFHPSGWFLEGDATWYQQSNQDLPVDLPGDDFWQFNASTGYRFLQRRVELKVGVLNITDQDYRLYPLNPYLSPRRDRTFFASCRFLF